MTRRNVIMKDIALESPLDVMEIMRLVPHRYPFLLVDRIISLIPGQTIQGYKNVTINEPFFQGHFPSRPVMPGVLILEGMAQVGACLAYHTIPEVLSGKIVYFAGIDKARFRRPVVPGDQLHYRLEMLKQKRAVIVMAGRATVDEQLVAEAELMASFA